MLVGQQGGHLAREKPAIILNNSLLGEDVIPGNRKQMY